MTKFLEQSNENRFFVISPTFLPLCSAHCCYSSPKNSHPFLLASSSSSSYSPLKLKQLLQKGFQQCILILLGFYTLIITISIKTFTPLMLLGTLTTPLSHWYAFLLHFIYINQSLYLCLLLFDCLLVCVFYVVRIWILEMGFLNLI